MKKEKKKRPPSFHKPPPPPAPSPYPIPPTPSRLPQERNNQHTNARYLFCFSFHFSGEIHWPTTMWKYPSLSLLIPHHALGIAKRGQGEGAPSLPFSLFSRLSTPTLPSPRQPPTSHLPFNPFCLPFTCSGWVAVAWGWPRGSRRGRQGGGAARRRWALGGGGPLGCRGSGG